MLAQPIGHSQISSHAFYAAELRSERVRIFGLLAFLGVVFVALTVRVFLLHTTVLSPHVAWNFSLAAALGLFEYAMLHLVNRALHKDQEFPRFLWLTSTVLETAVPAIGVAWLTTTDFASAYRPLASPRHPAGAASAKAAGPFRVRHRRLEQAGRRHRRRFLRLGRYVRRPPHDCAWRCDRARHRSGSARSRVPGLRAFQLCRSHRSVRRDDAD